MSISSAGTAALPRGFPGYVALLRTNSDVRNIWLAQVVSQFGDWFNSVALLGLIYQITQDALAPAVVQTLTVLPNALSGLTVGGYIADRFDRKKLAVGMDIMRAVVALALLLVHSTDTLWIAYAVIVMLSLGESIFGPAISAAQPNLCKPHELATANALQQSTWASVSMLGAFVGGVVTTIFGREVAFLVNALSFAVSALFLIRVRGSFSTPGQRAGGVSLRALTEGGRFLLRSPTVLGMSLAKSIFAVTFATAGLYSVFSYQIYNTGDAGTSWLYAARGIGSFLGPLIAQSFLAPHSLKQYYAIMLGGFVVALAGYGVWGASTMVIVGALGIFIGHLGSGNLWTYSRIYVQRETPDGLRGRVMALDMVGFTLIMGAFSIVWGVVAQRSTPGIGVLAGVGFTSALALIWTAWMARRVRRDESQRVHAKA
jgi:MFS family permease